MEMFIEQNKKFLHRYKYYERTKRTLLVEESCGIRFIDHCMMMQAMMLSIAQKFKILIVKSDSSPSEEWIKAYSSNATYVEYLPISFLKKLYIKFVCLLKIIAVLLFDDPLSFSYRGITYGHLLYDSILASKCISSFSSRNIKFIIPLYKSMCSIAVRHEISNKMIQVYSLDAILVSHMIGVQAGVLAQAGIAKGINVYINFGIHKNTLHKFNQKNLVKYAYTPRLDEIKSIRALKNFEGTFEKIRKMHMRGEISLDTQYAYGAKTGLYTERGSFCVDYNLDPGKKNIFVMLHAFTDHPHSHFKRMLFRDYGDWFRQTLDFSFDCDSVNWVFKRHPSERFYPTHDVDFNALTASLPKHVVFLDQDVPFSTANLGVVADAVVTCSGSAGYEMPALYGIPSIVAADNPYVGYDFVTYPQTIGDYFSALRATRNIQKLSLHAQKTAKAMYMFILYYSHVDYSFIPFFSLAEHRGDISEQSMYERILEGYVLHTEKIHEEISTYITKLMDLDFVAMRRDIIDVQ